MYFISGLQTLQASDSSDWGYWGENGNYDNYDKTFVRCIHWNIFAIYMCREERHLCNVFDNNLFMS